MTAGQTPISFGAHAGFFIRRQVRESLEVKTLRETKAFLGQIIYLAFLRVDGGLIVGAAGHPIPVMTLVMA